MTAQDPRQQALADIETRREIDGEPELEKDLSINDWIDRIKAAAGQAHRCARIGAVESERSTWIDIAAIALGRIEVLEDSRE